MLTNQQLYYLQTMGIDPWVLRDVPQASMLVLAENIDFSSDEQMLLDVMFESIGLDSTQVCIEPFSKDVLQHHKASVVIALGDIAKNAQQVMTLPHPADLLEHPIKKRQAYEALGRLQSALHS